MRRWILNIVLTVVLLPAAMVGLLLTRHALAGAPPDISTVTSLPIGSSTWSMQHDGRERTFRVYFPESAIDSNRAPLVVMLHGGFGTAKQAEKAYGWDDLADREGIVILYPNGLRRTWNAGDCCGYSARKEIDDVGFITSAIDAVRQRIAIDPTRIYATGISNGGMMSYRLACETSIFAAIAPVAATLQSECSSPDPISVIHIHGGADNLVRFDGEPGHGVANVDGPSVPDVINFWREVDQCKAALPTVRGAVSTEISTCSEANAVELIVVANAGHQWPGSVSKFTGSTITRENEPSDALDATETIWEFFAAHPAP